MQTSSASSLPSSPDGYCSLHALSVRPCHLCRVSLVQFIHVLSAEFEDPPFSISSATNMIWCRRQTDGGREIREIEDQYAVNVRVARPSGNHPNCLWNFVVGSNAMKSLQPGSKRDRNFRPC